MNKLLKYLDTTVIFSLITISSISLIKSDTTPTTVYSDPEQYLLDFSYKLDPLSELLPKTKLNDSSITETIEENKLRRKKIIRDVWIASSDSSIPILFKGSKGRIYTALFVLGLWHEESHYDLRVDKYHCQGLPKGSCDNGSAWCMGQIHPKDLTLPEGWTGLSLQEDNVKCAKATIWRLNASMLECKHLKGSDKFSHYAIGKCEVDNFAMKIRYGHGERWANKYQAP